MTIAAKRESQCETLKQEVDTLKEDFLKMKNQMDELLTQHLELKGILELLSAF